MALGFRPGSGCARVVLRAYGDRKFLQVMSDGSGLASILAEMGRDHQHCTNKWMPLFGHVFKNAALSSCVLFIRVPSVSSFCYVKARFLLPSESCRAAFQRGLGTDRDGPKNARSRPRRQAQLVPGSWDGAHPNRSDHAARLHPAWIGSTERQPAVLDLTHSAASVMSRVQMSTEPQSATVHETDVSELHALNTLRASL